MMKKNNMLAFALLGGLVLLAAGCVKETDMNEKYRPEGTPIHFSAATGYENGDGTRTEYSGHFFDGQGNEVTSTTLSSYTGTYERIDWVNNDPVLIYYKHPDNSSTNAGYSVSGKTADREYSDASIEVATGSSRLTWAGGSGNHIFTAMYPTNNFGGNSTITFNGTNVGGRIPSTQTITGELDNNNALTGKYFPQMQYAYMVARKTIDGTSTESDVFLPFTPAYTAFEFRLRKPASITSSYNVKSFTITSTSYLAGNFSLTIDGENARGATWSTTPSVANDSYRSNSVTVTFNGNRGVALSSSQDLDFTLFALPIPIANLTLAITYTDNTTKRITLKDSNDQPKSFDPCKKYIITNTNAGFEDWEYIVDPITSITTYGHDAASGNFEVHSYRVSRADNTIKQAVPWKIQYTTADNPSASDWHDLTSSGYVNSTLNATFQVNTLTGNGALPAPATGEARTASVSGQTPGAEEEAGTNPSSAARAKLASTQARGTWSAPFDLSRHPFYGNNITGTPGNINSANCYIVSAPGVYMFPCVYGNSIKNGNINVSSYDPAHATDVVSATGLSQLKDVNSTYNTTSYPSHYYLPTFRNAWNEAISSYDIFTDCSIASGDESAIVVWQDTAVGDEIIPYKSGEITNTDALDIISQTVDGRTYKYIKFKIDAENIKPGNIMIALRDGSHIVWSWHIWVTEKDLEPQSTDQYTLTLDDNSTATFTLMPFNLGWLDSASGSVVKYKDRPIHYRVVQIDNVTDKNILSYGYNNGNGRAFDFTQIGDAKEITPTIGGNPYYQWGRKDPLIPSTEGGGNRPFSQNPELGDNISPTVGVPHVNSTSADYGTGIQHPYFYYSNNLTTGWVGGTAYPYFKSADYMMHRVNGEGRMSGPYTQRQCVELMNLGVTPAIVAAGYWTMDSRGFWYFDDGGPMNLGPYSSTTVDAILAVDDMELPNTTGDHFKRTDFYNTYTPTEKRNAVSCMYNLWNGFIYSDQPTRGTFGGTLPTETMAAAYHRNKFKTVYDPCPAGFAVPTKASYIGDETFTYSEVDHGSYVERWKGAAPFPGQTMAFSTGDVAGVGITVNGMLFPYTGARVCYNDGAGNVVLSPEGQGSQGFYWSDNPLMQEPVYSGSDNYYAIGSYYFFQHAYIFMFGSGVTISAAVQDFTRGSAGSIRPMLETNSNDI